MLHLKYYNVVLTDDIKAKLNLGLYVIGPVNIPYDSIIAF